ncbi:MAG: DUF1080 domain-containing protein [Planctomycetes bacterium]|nr:DUF1080 domain-containing protein [Planctomycetota bacterium]
MCKPIVKKSKLMIVLIALSYLCCSMLLAAQEDDGYRSIFNGQDFTGWLGGTHGYKIENGSLVCQSNKNIMTVKKYTNFILRFEFALEAGANNGIALRSPLKATPYNMMEIQVLDNSSPKYSKLKPYQYHGSAYGWSAAKKGALKAVGEWNEQEIHVLDSIIKITLNGKLILDVDLDTIKPNLSGKHKGAWNETGHLGLLGHGKGVRFRNLRIKEIGNDSR